MNTKGIIGLLSAGVLIVLAFILAFNAQNTGIKNSATSEPTADAYHVDPSDMLDSTSVTLGSSTGTLTEKEKEGLIQMREEEKLAHDVYAALGAKWGIPVFDNIAQSEQTHTDAMKSLLSAYGVPDPAQGKAAGEFTSPTMQKLYTDLVAQGNTSLIAALTVGATIEDLDIHDLDIRKAETTKEDILFVYNNLQKGSRNHTRGFVRNLQTRGTTYTPQYISQADFDAILASPQERGPQIER